MSIPIPSPSVLILLSSLMIPPRPILSLFTIRTFQWPLTLLLHAPKSLTHLPPTTLRPITIARAVETYVLAYFFLGFINALIRLTGRVRSRYTGNQDHRYGGLKTKRILGVRPILKGLIWHLIAWRLVTLPTAPSGLGSALGLAKGAGMYWDVPTLVGVAGGLVAFWDELSGMLGLFGWKKDPQSGPSWKLSITHVLLCAHRLVLAGRILSAGVAKLSMNKV